MLQKAKNTLAARKSASAKNVIGKGTMRRNSISQMEARHCAAGAAEEVVAFRLAHVSEQLGGINGAIRLCCRVDIVRLCRNGVAWI